jgi:hypothetical protein
MKTILKTSVAAAALVAFTAPAMAEIENGNAKVKLKVYGQVHKAMLWGDDGKNDRVMVVDGQASSTRLGFLAEAPVNADFSFGANLEMEWRSNQGSGVAINNGGSGGGTAQDNAIGTNSFTERKAEVTMTHKRFGKLSLGQGDEASQDASEYNLSGATLAIGLPNATGYLTNTALFNKAGNAYLTTTLGAVFGNIDGDRDDRVRYDTPNFMGFVASASFTSGGGSAAALKYDGKVGQFKILGAVAYNNDSGISTTVENEVIGSISVLHDSGVNASFSYGNRNHKTPATGTANTPDDATHIGGSVGYIAKIFGVGPTAFAADYYKTENLNRAKTASTTTEWKVKTFGIGVQQDFTDIGSSVFMTYRNFDVDAPTGTTVDDVNLVLAGVRVVF